MKIEHYEINTPVIKPPSGEWKQCWYGLYRLQECYSDEAWQQFKNAEAEAHKLNCLGERELEVDIFLSILKDIKSSSVTFMELGAGYGDWCMALNGVVRNRLIKTDIREPICYAVEAEPKHIEWLLEHFKKWNIKGDIFPCVISDRNGMCKFAVDVDPSASYGQSVAYTDSPIRTAGNLLRRKMITMYSLKLDSLLKMKKIDHIDLIDMDVQGNEVRVIRGASESIDEGKIDYWKIGTHGKKYNKKLEKILTPYYDLLVNVYPYSIGGVDGLLAKVEDGIQVYRRKGL